MSDQKEPRKCLLHFEGHGGSVDGVWLAGKAKRHSIDLHQNASNRVAFASDLSCKQATTCRTSIHRARASQMHVIAGCDRVQPVRPFKWQALYSVFLPKNMCRINCFPVLSSVHRLDYHFCRMGGVDVLTDSGSGEMMAG